jgi:hypothetical protein
MLLMTLQRLRAPAADGALLAEPPLSEAGARLLDNVGRLARWDHDFQGRRSGRLRAMARQQVLDRACDYHARFGLDRPDGDVRPDRLLVAGHQPELYHPGVWVKNFALAGLVREQPRGAALNLIVDNDIPKAASIRVPRSSPEGLRTHVVDFGDGAGEVPYEDWRVRDEGRFATFGERVREVLDPRVADPLIDDFWPRVLGTRDRTDRVGLRFALARRELEASWGVRNWEVPLSAVCETEAFLWFTSHMLANLPRFQAVHNAALARYRVAHGIRSTHHPVPALRGEGPWREAPFWAWRADEPRRRPLMVRQLDRAMELRISGETEPFLEIPLAPDREACCAVEQLQDLPGRRIRLRTRALTTTLFARMLLGDIFLHGIGGAKYDELGDEIAREFYGFEPPSYLTLSMTLWLGLGDDPAAPGQLHEVERALRDLTYNPDRHLAAPVPPELWRRVEAKREAIAAPVETHPKRVARFRAIRRCNEALQGAVQPARAELLERRAELLEGLRRNAVARNREYAFVLHSEERLRAAMARAVPSAFRS